MLLWYQWKVGINKEYTDFAISKEDIELNGWDICEMIIILDS